MPAMWSGRFSLARKRTAGGYVRHMLSYSPSKLLEHRSVDRYCSRRCPKPWEEGDAVCLLGTARGINKVLESRTFACVRPLHSVDRQKEEAHIVTCLQPYDA